MDTCANLIPHGPFSFNASFLGPRVNRGMEFHSNQIPCHLSEWSVSMAKKKDFARKKKSCHAPGCCEFLATWKKRWANSFYTNKALAYCNWRWTYKNKKWPIPLVIVRLKILGIYITLTSYFLCWMYYLFVQICKTKSNSLFIFVS